MNEFQAFLLGIIQGLTEFLPVSSSGHLEIGHNLLGIHGHNNLQFAIVVHAATVLSTVFVFRKDIGRLFSGLFSFKWNEETKYITKLLVSSLPVIIIGLLLQKDIESVFSGNLTVVGIMLIATAILLSLTQFFKSKSKKISYPHAIIIGIAQALAVMPGISRSGSTIATGLLLGNKKEEVARFSFLMVLIPIIGAVIYSFLNGDFNSEEKIALPVIAIGFLSAFISGLLACKWMIKIVKKGKLIYFAIYCLIIGLIAIFAA